MSRVLPVINSRSIQTIFPSGRKTLFPSTRGIDSLIIPCGTREYEYRGAIDSWFRDDPSKVSCARNWEINSRGWLRRRGVGWVFMGWKEEGSSIIYIVSRNLNRKLSRIRGIDGGVGWRDIRFWKISIISFRVYFSTRKRVINVIFKVYKMKPFFSFLHSIHFVKE